MSFIKNVAVVGASGNLGRFIVEALLKTGKHNVTAISRIQSDAKPAEGVHLAKVDYDDPNALIAALKGQDALVITMSVRSPKGQQNKLFDAAAAAGVPFIIPSEWGLDNRNEQLGKDVFIGVTNAAARAYIEKLGKSSWISVACGFWYEFSLGGTIERYGFDFKDRKIIYFDKGTTRINTTTWPQVGRAVASLLSLPIDSDASGSGPSLSDFKNNFCRVSSFYVSQKDMFESVARVTGTTEKDWDIQYEDSKVRYESGLQLLQTGNPAGFARLLYTRVFYPDGSGDFNSDLHNDILGLPEEDLDAATGVAIEYFKNPSY